MFRRTLRHMSYKEGLVRNDNHMILLSFRRTSQCEFYFVITIFFKESQHSEE